MNTYQFSPTNPGLDKAYQLRAELRSLQAGDRNLPRQLLLAIRYRWNEVISGEKLPR